MSGQPNRDAQGEGQKRMEHRRFCPCGIWVTSPSQHTTLVHQPGSSPNHTLLGFYGGFMTWA